MDVPCNLTSAMLEGISSGSGPYYYSLYICIAVSIAVFLISTLTKNVSQVDKLWSIIPFVYTWIPVCDGRTLLMAVVATIWGLRLTYNFYRRGGYSWPPWFGEEDYRWEEIRQGKYIKALQNPWVFALFNLVFISFYQNFLLLLIATPSLVAYTAATEPCGGTFESPLNIIDWVIAGIILLFVVMETIADNQQYSFQTEKYRQINAGIERKGAYKDGFCQSGLFSILRKPNYTAEQSIWVSFYLFSVNATGWKLFNWSGLGWVLLLLLFQGSGALTEKLTLMKYPAYAEYQKRVPLYVPNFSSLCKKRNEGEESGENQPLVS